MTMPRYHTLVQLQTRPRPSGHTGHTVPSPSTHYCVGVPEMLLPSKSPMLVIGHSGATAPSVQKTMANTSDVADGIWVRIALVTTSIPNAPKLSTTHHQHNT